MKRIIKYALLSLLLGHWSGASFSQDVYTIKADSTRLTGCDSNELIIGNHTQNVPGFLFNTGNGRTKFKRALQKINDSIYVIGADTLKLSSSGGTATLQQVLSAGSTLTSDNEIINTDHTLSFTGGSYKINGLPFGTGNVLVRQDDSSLAQMGLAAGTYTPTLTNLINVSGTGINDLLYYRIGNLVTVSGTLFVSSTAVGTKTNFRITLPFATSFSNPGSDGSGVATILDQSVIPNITTAGYLTGNIATGRAIMEFMPTTTAPEAIIFTFMYVID